MPCPRLARPLGWLLAAVAALAVLLLGWMSVAHMRLFTFDSMNYVDVAHNIASGAGIVQSTAGFNETRLWPDGTLAPPLTSQPPGYPLAIAALGRLGLELPTAALIVTVLGLALTLAALYWLGRVLYGPRAGALAMALGLAFMPLRAVASIAWSETVAIGLWLVALVLVARARRGDLGRASLVFAAGLATGLAFATRYAMLVGLPIAALGLFARGDRAGSARRIALLVAGFALIAGPLLVRNLALSGHALGPPRNPSTVGLTENLDNAATEAFGAYLGDHFTRAVVTGQAADDDEGIAPTARTQKALALIALSVLAVAAAFRRRHLPACELAARLWSGGRWLPVAFAALYLAFIVWQRSRVHFDGIDARIALPGTIALVVPVGALLARAVPGRLTALVLALGLTAWVAIGEARAIAATPRHDPGRELADSARRRWIAEHTTDGDLIVGTDTMDVPFHHPGRLAVSVSPYPYGDRVDHATLLGWVCPRATGFDNVYLVIRQRDDAAERLGAFSADILAGRTAAYPGVRLIEILDDAAVARLDCELFSRR